MTESWELTAQEQAALPAWARRGVMLHKPVRDAYHEMVCDNCDWRDAPWALDGCEVVVLTRALAQTEIERVAARSDAAALRSVLTAVSAWMSEADPAVTEMVTELVDLLELNQAAYWDGLVRRMRMLDRAVNAAISAAGRGAQPSVGPSPSPDVRA